MFIRVKERKNGKKSVQIVANYRRGDKVHQKIIRHIGQAANDEEVKVLKRLAESIIVSTQNEKQPVLPLFAPEDIYGIKKNPVQDKVRIKDLREEQRIVEGIGEVFGKLYTQLGFDYLIGETKKDKQWNAILKSLVIARVANPVSKRRTASLLEQDYAIKIPLEKIYRMMDHVYDREEEIKGQVGNSTLNIFKQEVDVLFFDVTTLYFESIQTDELRDFGFSKDCKFKEVQVVLALATTTDGLPVTYEVFSGNIYEGKTLIAVIKQLKERYNISNILLVADRGMFSNDNLKLMEKEEVNYIVAARLKNLPGKTKEMIIQDDDYKACIVENELHWVKEYEHNSKRLIVSYSTKRAKKDSSDRQRLIERLMKKKRDGKITIKDLIPNYGTKKYLKIKGGDATIDEERIELDQRWDGLHGVITNLKDESAINIISRYRCLWQIEEAFRVNKHDLKMRPIYHWTPRRVRAHIAICFLAFALVKQAIYRMKHQQIMMSFEQIRNELLHVQSSVVQDIETKKRYIIPSHITINQKRIYKAFGLKRKEVPYAFK